MAHHANPVRGAGRELATALANAQPAGPARRPPVDDPAQFGAAPGTGPGRFDVGGPIEATATGDQGLHVALGLPQVEQLGPQQPNFVGFFSGGRGQSG